MPNANYRIWGLIAALILGFLSAGTHASEDAVRDISLTVHKHRFCFCCKDWMDHLEESGFSTITLNQSTKEMSQFKGSWGIPDGLHGCHTGVWNNEYVFEGHVPARLIRQFLSNPPEGAIGLTVPGMPEGSPGMYKGKNFKPYQVYLLLKGGDYRLYATVDRPENAAAQSE